jgi:hypothetical protein
MCLWCAECSRFAVPGDAQSKRFSSQFPVHSRKCIQKKTDAVEDCVELVGRILGIKSSNAEHQDILLLRYDRRIRF